MFDKENRLHSRWLNALSSPRISTVLVLRLQSRHHLMIWTPLFVQEHGKLLMLVKEIIGEYSENHTTHINPLCE